MISVRKNIWKGAIFLITALLITGCSGRTTFTESPAVSPTLADMTTEDRYQEAIKLMNEKNLAMARYRFIKLGDYKESNSFADELIIPLLHDTVTYFCSVRSDGTVQVPPISDYQTVYSELSTWKNIKSVTKIGADVIVGLKTDGTLNLLSLISNTGSNKMIDDMKGWTDLVQLTGTYVACGLKKNGTVVVTGSDYLKDMVKNWTDITAICAYNEQLGQVLAGLKNDGTVVVAGTMKLVTSKADQWKDMAMIRTGIDCLIGIKDEGTVVKTGGTDANKFDFTGFNDIADAFSFGDSIFLIDKDGNIIITGKGSENKRSLLEISKWQDITRIYYQNNNYIGGLRNDGSISLINLMDTENTSMGYLALKNMSGIMVP